MDSAQKRGELIALLESAQAMLWLITIKDETAN
jgi:hypothetical protein